MDKLFKTFSQLHGNVNSSAGTGLGLVITERYVEMHGGRIEVESEFGVGSEFSVLLPFDAAQARPATTHTPTVARVSESAEFSEMVKGVVILCIDDEPDALKYLTLTLGDAGYNVIEADNYDTALESVRRNKPDLICLDLQMPGRDGYEILQALRSDREFADIPVVVASVDAEHARQIGSGAAAYITKPIAEDDIKRTLRDILVGKVASVLVVEDEEDTLRLIAVTLGEHGVEVRTAANGVEGLAQLASFRPEVILLDLMMPQMDGFEFLKRLKADPSRSLIPVVVLTAKILSPKEIDALTRHGAVILAKGRGDTEEMVDAVLTAGISAHREARFR